MRINAPTAVNAVNKAINNKLRVFTIPPMIIISAENNSL